MNTSNPDHSVFDTHGPEWWDPNGPFWTLHRIQPIRFHWLKPFLTNSKTALDIGCGGGLLSEDLAKHGLHVTSIDQSHNAIVCAQSHAQTQSLNIDYRHGSLEKVISPSETFDAIFLLEVLEHVSDPQQLIYDASQHLSPHGQLFCSTLNRNPVSFMASIVMAEHVLQWLPVGTHQYKHFIKPSEMTQFAMRAGLQPMGMSGIHYDLIKQQFSLCQSPKINYIMAFSHA